MKNPIHKAELFDTPTTYNDLVDWCMQLSGSERTVALTAAHMALNLASTVVDKALEREYNTHTETH